MVQEFFGFYVFVNQFSENFKRVLNDNQFFWEFIGGFFKIRNMLVCWQDGWFFVENEMWVVDSCIMCICKKFKIICY